MNRLEEILLKLAENYDLTDFQINAVKTFMTGYALDVLYDSEIRVECMDEALDEAQKMYIPNSKNG